MTSPRSNNPDSGEVELDELTSLMLDLVDTVPAGQVVSYGDVAAEVGTGPRQIGRLMARYGHLTHWWRVVRADGTSAVSVRAIPYWDAEGIGHRSGRVNMKAHRWGGE